MAVIKAVSSKAGINTVLDYVMQEEKTEQKLLSGLNCVPDTVKDEMRVTKLLWDKDGGRTYKHFVQSFAPGEKINPAQAHQIACQLAASRPEWQDFEVLIATHEDKEHIHTHFVVNSVSYVDGHKLQQSKAGTHTRSCPRQSAYRPLCGGDDRTEFCIFHLPVA